MILPPEETLDSDVRLTVEKVKNKKLLKYRVPIAAPELGVCAEQVT